MNSDEKMKQLKAEYEQLSIPTKLDQMVQEAIDQERRNIKMKQDQNKKTIRNVSVAVAATVCLFIGSINVSPAIANNLAGIPGLGTLVQVCTFRDYTINDDTYNANLSVPKVSGLDENVAGVLNEKYLAEGKALYDQFMVDVESMKDAGLEGHLGVDSGYEVKTDNEDVFAICRYVVNTVGSSSTTMTYDTVDLKNQLIVTLPSLFQEDSDYVTVISDNIKSQMAEQMKADESLTYWFNDEMMGDENFKQIAPEQTFYINSDGKLVISFDKYMVAPGYMGVVEFVIPTEILSDILLNRGLIK